MNKPMILYIDASDQCIGTCLTQLCPENDSPFPGIPEEIPIYFISHKLSSTQQRWPVIEKEAYVIVYTLQKFDHSLNGAQFTVKTDHNPLKYIFKENWTNKKIQQQALKISRYNCTIEYLSGKENSCDDLLSRMPNKLEQESKLQETEIDDKSYQINVINLLRLHHRQGLGDLGTLEEMPKSEMPRLGEYLEDEEIKALKRTIDSGKASKAFLEKYMAQDRLLYHLSDRNEKVRLRLYIPKLIREDQLKQIHDDVGHMGVDKIYKLIGRKYFGRGCTKKSRILLTHVWFVNQGVANVKTHLLKKMMGHSNPSKK